MKAEDAVLRPASNADGAAVRALISTILIEYGMECDYRGIDADLLDLDRAYAAGGGVFHVLQTRAGEIIGTVGLLPLREGVCELRKMYLRTDWRGRGWGRRLLSHALAEAARRGYGRIELETASVLVEAIGLYEQTGFVPIADRHLNSRCNLAYGLDLVSRSSPADGPLRDRAL